MIVKNDTASYDHCGVAVLTFLGMSRQLPIRSVVCLSGVKPTFLSESLIFLYVKT